tara:strand:- start:395 stop:1093 length:699 start_codon:yes stop_codon:yes gene_type:complete
MDYKSLDDKTSTIISNLQVLNNNISLLKKKILTINNVNSKLEKNKILKQDVNNNLIFQSSMLKNELSYYSNIYNIILQKYSKELFELADYILIILVSLNKLEIENSDKKKSIFSKIIFTKKFTKKSSGNLKQLFTGIINNLKVVDEFIQLFNKYIKQIKNQNTDKNLHSDNFEININYKKDIITIEYKKYCDKFLKTINYFMNCSNCVIDQIETSKLLNFFLKLKLKDNVEN